MNNLINDVKDFHKACDLPDEPAPCWPTTEDMMLRQSLITEEHDEFVQALRDRDLLGVADALGDMIYVIVGTALTFGIPLDSVWNEIHLSNMTKVGDDGKVRRREDGKILKPENWEEPDIFYALYRHDDDERSL